jgi:hypothetical protein
VLEVNPPAIPTPLVRKLREMGIFLTSGVN